MGLSFGGALWDQGSRAPARRAVGFGDVRYWVLDVELYRVWGSLGF